MLSVCRQYKFSALHKLLEQSNDPKCVAKHGHEYLLQVSVMGGKNSPQEMVKTRDQLDRTIHSLLAKLNTSELNTIYSSSSGESLAHHVQREIQALHPRNPIRVFIRETRKNFFAG